MSEIPLDHFKGTPLLEEMLGCHRGVTTGGDQDQADNAVSTVLAQDFIIDASGTTMTNHHVIAGADEVRVRAFDGREYPCCEDLIGSRTDIAILSLEGAHGLKAATFGDSDESGVGGVCACFRQPFGLENCG